MVTMGPSDKPGLAFLEVMMEREGINCTHLLSCPQGQENSPSVSWVFLTLLNHCPFGKPNLPVSGVVSPASLAQVILRWATERD